MKIALVTPSPIPYITGGAEKLFLGMFYNFNTISNIEMELIKIPCKDQEFWSLIKCYEKFYNLDLSHFDAVITTKYPAWMIQHPNHILYMQHTCRGVYDLYKDSKDFSKITQTNPLLKDLENILNTTQYNVKALFEELNKLYNIKESFSNSEFAFPNPLTRAIIHYLDKTALSPQNISSYNAISKNVASREDYFPKNIPINIIYHPSSLQNFSNKDYKYIFTASRLEDLKRIDLLIKAYKKIDTDIPFYIAGTGGQEKKLKELAKDDKRIKFLGYITDKELLNYYVNALFIPYIPFDEDYGLITIEAMNSSKAILTTNDSGGVKEFVKNNINGLIVNPTIKDISNAINTLISNKNKTIQMGQNAKKTIQNITWKNLINQLIQKDKPIYTITNKSKKNRPKITLISTFAITPPISGGQNRIYHLYKNLSNLLDIDIELISLTNTNNSFEKVQITNNFIEIKVPKSKKHQQVESQIEKELGISVTDITIQEFYHYTPSFEQAIKNSIIDSNLIILEHPYTFNIVYSIIKNLKKEIPIIYSSHNVEYLLKKDMLPNTPISNKYLQQIFDIENSALNKSNLIITCSSDDKANFYTLYKTKNKIEIIPNGVDIDTIKYIPQEDRLKIKKRLNFTNTKIAIFIGSYHKPNIDATKEIIKLAQKTPNINYIIIGSVKDYFKNFNSKNLSFTGVISNKEKNLYLSIADIALNPMLSGSGTNLKILEYLASGIPTITTPIGARGLNLPNNALIISKIQDFDKNIKKLDSINTKIGREFIKSNYNWIRLSKKLVALIKNSVTF